jgi:hypothetical protein
MFSTATATSVLWSAELGQHTEGGLGMEESHELVSCALEGLLVDQSHASIRSLF